LIFSSRARGLRRKRGVADAENKCSQNTAHRDIVELLEHGILAKDAAGARSTSYSLIEPGG
jgi:Fic family protein